MERKKDEEELKFVILLSINMNVLNLLMEVFLRMVLNLLKILVVKL